VSKQHPKVKHLHTPRNALVKIRTTHATLDSARRAAEQEGVSLSHWIELTILTRLKATQPASETAGAAAPPIG